jgi:regulator of sigma E protease
MVYLNLALVSLLFLLAFFCLGKTFSILIKVFSTPSKVNPFEGLKFAAITIVAVWSTDLILKHPFENIRTFILSILCILLIYLIITLHEIGHYFAAKLIGVDIKEFVVGQGISLYEITRNHIKYQIKLFPTSGHVGVDAKQLENQSTIKQILFYSGGIIINVFSGILALLFQFLFFSREQTIKTWDNIGIAFEKLFMALEINSFKDVIINPNLDGREELFIFRFFLTDYYSLPIIFFLLSLTIAITNLLPILPLDGGKIMWILIERPLLKMKVSKQILSRILLTITVLGLILIKGPMIINFTLHYAQMINMTVIELLLWTALFVTIVINIFIFIHNRTERKLN